MKKLVKVLAAVVGIVVVVVVAAVILIPMLVDPNDYKDRIESAVREETGRELRIEGDIELSVFPWLGLEMGVVELGNAPGFDEKVFARTERVDVHVELLPLLGREIRMDTVTVHGLRLNLARDADGRGNWEDLAQAGGAPPEGKRPEKGEGPAIAALAVGGLDVRDAEVTWADARSGERYELSGLTVRTGELTPGVPVELEVGFDVKGPRGLAGRVELGASVSISRDGERFEARDLALDVAVSGEAIPAGEVEASLAAGVTADLRQQTLNVSALELALLDVVLTGDLAVTGLQATPQVTGSINVADFNPRALLDDLGVALETSDETALTAAGLALKISASPTAVSLQPFEIKVDETTISGNVEVTDPARAALRFDVNVDAVDVDRYLPPQGDAEPASPGAAASSAGTIPSEQLRALDAEGSMRIGALTVAKLNLTDVAVTLAAKDGLIRLDPIQARLYQGTYEGHVRLDARGDVPKLAVDERLAGVEAGPLLDDLQDGDGRLTGTGDVTLKLSASGAAPEAMKRTLDGEVEFSFSNGAVKGINVARMIREAKAKLQGKTLAAGEREQSTDFSALTGSVQLRDGVATNEDLLAKSPLLRVEGRGTASLPEETVDYRLKTTVVATTEGQGGADLAELSGVPIPIRVRGTFSEPRYSLDFEAFASAVAKSKAGAVVEGQKEGLTEKAAEKLEGLGEGAGDAIKGLFGD